MSLVESGGVVVGKDMRRRNFPICRRSGIGAPRSARGWNGKLRSAFLFLITPKLGKVSGTYSDACVNTLRLCIRTEMCLTEY